MVYKKKKSYYKKLAIYALIAIPAYLIIANYYGDDIYGNDFLSENYFNTYSEEFIPFDLGASSQLIKCKILSTVKLYDSSGNIIYDYTRKTGTFSPAVQLDLLYPTGGNNFEKIQTVNFKQQLQCNAVSYDPYLKPLLTKVDLRTTVNGIDQNGQSKMIQSKSHPNQSRNMSGSTITLVEMNIPASSIENKLGSERQYTTSLVFLTNGKLEFKQYDDDPNKWIKQVNNAGASAGFTIKGKTYGIGCPSGCTVEIKVDNAVNSGADRFLDIANKVMRYDIRLDQYTKDETIPKLELKFQPAKCKDSSCIETLRSTAIGMSIRNDDGYWSGNQSLDWNGDGKYDKEDAGHYFITVKGGEVEQGQYKRTNTAVIKAVVTSTEPENGVPPITQTSGNPDILVGKVKIKYTTGSSLEGFIDTDGSVQLTPLDLYGSGEGKDEGKIIKIMLEPYLYYPQKPSYNVATSDITYTGTVTINGKDKNISTKYLNARGQAVNSPTIEDCPKGLNYDNCQMFRVAPLYISATNLNDIITKSGLLSDRNSETNVKFKFELDGDFRFYELGGQSKKYNGLIKDTEISLSLDYKPPTTRSGNGGSGNGNGGNGGEPSDPECRSGEILVSGVCEREDVPEICYGNEILNALGICVPVAGSDPDLPPEVTDDTIQVDYGDAFNWNDLCEPNEQANLFVNNATGEQEVECVNDDGEIVPSGQTPTGDEGGTAIGDEETTTIPEIEEELTTFSIGFGSIAEILDELGLPAEFTIAFILVGLIILFVIYKVSRRGYRNRQSYFGQMP